MKIRDAITGAASIAKTSVGIGRVSLPVYRDRLQTCKACPQLDDGRCSLCRCIMKFKARDTDQICPLGYWRK